MDYTTIISAAAGIIGTIITQYAIKLKNKADARKTHFEGDAVLVTNYSKLIEEIKTLKDNTDKENAELRERLRECEKNGIKNYQELTELKFQLIQLESADFDMPFPRWIKDHEGKMLKLNKSYEQIFLTPNGKKMMDYIGKTDVDIWGEEIGKMYQENDQWVMKNKKVWRGTEKVNIDGKISDCKIVKYPFFAGGTIIGVAGVGITE